MEIPSPVWNPTLPLADLVWNEHCLFKLQDLLHLSSLQPRKSSEVKLSGANIFYLWSKLCWKTADYGPTSKNRKVFSQWQLCLQTRKKKKKLSQTHFIKPYAHCPVKKAGSLISSFCERSPSWSRWLLSPWLAQAISVMQLENHWREEDRHNNRWNDLVECV